MEENVHVSPMCFLSLFPENLLHHQETGVGGLVLPYSETSLEVELSSVSEFL